MTDDEIKLLFGQHSAAMDVDLDDVVAFARELLARDRAQAAPCKHRARVPRITGGTYRQLVCIYCGDAQDCE